MSIEEIARRIYEACHRSRPDEESLAWEHADRYRPGTTALYKRIAGWHKEHVDVHISFFDPDITKLRDVMDRLLGMFAADPSFIEIFDKDKLAYAARKVGVVMSWDSPINMLTDRLDEAVSAYEKGGWTQDGDAALADWIKDVKRTLTYFKKKGQ